MFSLTIFIQHCIGDANQFNKEIKRIKKVSIFGKEEIKLSLLTQESIIYIEMEK